MSIIVTAAREYVTRPADERYPSLQAMVDAAGEDKVLNLERAYNLKDLQVVNGVVNGAETIQLQSPRWEAAFTHWSFGQVCRMLGAPAGYLRQLPPELAADCLNLGIAQSAPGTSANVLVRRANRGEPVIRACTSETYRRLWDVDLYGHIDQSLFHGEGRLSLPLTWDGVPTGAYKGDRDSFLIGVSGGSIVTDPTLSSAQAAMMYRGILVRNSEVGACSVVIDCVLYRHICGNHVLWGAVIDKQFRRRHVGQHVLRDTVREIGQVARQWMNRGESADQAIIRGLIDHELATTREAVVDELRAIGATKEQAEAAYDACEQHEQVSPRSYWGVAQGLTRVSQGEYQDGRYGLDRLAMAVLQRGAKLVRV